jgi:hypothetical protein
VDTRPLGIALLILTIAGYSAGMYIARRVRRPWRVSLLEHRLATSALMLGILLSIALLNSPPGQFAAGLFALLSLAAVLLIWFRAPMARRQMPWIETGLSLDDPQRPRLSAWRHAAIWLLGLCSVAVIAVDAYTPVLRSFGLIWLALAVGLAGPLVLARPVLEWMAGRPPSPGGEEHR